MFPLRKVLFLLVVMPQTHQDTDDDRWTHIQVYILCTDRYQLQRK